MWVPFIFALSVLTYASVHDFRKREVSNWIWLLAHPIGCIITIAGLAFNLLNVQTVLASFGISMILSVVLLYTGFYGSADVKALIFIGLTLPTLPITLNPILNVPALPLILTVFCNSAILSMVWPLFIFILNLKDIVKGKQLFEGINLTIREKVLLLFTTRCMPLEKLEKSLRYFPAEEVVLQEGKPNRKLLYFVKAETDLKKHLDHLKEHSELYQKGVLASPTIPTLVFFTVALALVPFGNWIF